MEGIVVGVVDDAADMVLEAEHLRRLHRLRIDPVDDRLAVRAIFRDRHPDVSAVVVDAARMIDRALSQRQLADEIALHVDLEEVADALPGIAVVAVDGLREALGRRLDLDRGDEKVVADLHHALRVVGQEVDRHGLRLASRPFRA